MPIVINLGRNLTVTKLHDTAKEISVVSHICMPGETDLIKEPELLKAFFINLINEQLDILHEKVIITLSYGSGIQYRTANISANDIIIDDRNMKAEDKENLILEKCNTFLPSGLSSLTPNWQACVMDAYIGDLDIIISCCYLPVDYLDNIKNIAAELGIDVMQITSLVFGLYRILDPKESQLIFEIPTGWLAINAFGVACWPRPQNCQLTNEQIINDLSATTERLFNIDSNLMNVILDDYSLENYVKKPIMYSGQINPFIIAAAGCVLGKVPKAQQENNREGGRFNEITGKLRQLFIKKGKQ